MLTQTQSGNWAKEVIHERKSWKKVTFKNVPKSEADRIAAEHEAKGRKTDIRSGRPCQNGQAGYQVWALIVDRIPRMIHASKEDCLSAGVQPGKCNRN